MRVVQSIGKGRETSRAARARWLWAPALLAGVLASAAPRVSARPPNVVIILCDDTGWGDLGTLSGPRTLKNSPLKWIGCTFV